MAAGNQQKHLEFTLSIRALPFHLRASIPAHKHIFQYLKWLNCWKSRGEAFFQRDSIPIFCHALWKLGNSTCCSFEMKHATGLKTCKGFIFCLSSTLCKWEFVKLRYFDLTIRWRHRENHLFNSLCRVTNVIAYNTQWGTQTPKQAWLLQNLVAREARQWTERIKLCS